MSGHSKWATTKRAKAITDAKRGAIFTKLSNLITMAAKEKGGDLEANFVLRMAVEKARMANVPKDNIEKAIKRGTGELGGGTIEEYYYEGIGPLNSQFVIKSLSDSKNRSAATIRHTFSKHGGSLGSVMWNFERRGVIFIADAKILADDLEMELIEAGVDDIVTNEGGIAIFTKIENLQKVKKFLDEKKIATESAEIEYVAKEKLKLSEAEMEKIEGFIDELDNNEDVADYYSNLDI